MKEKKKTTTTAATRRQTTDDVQIDLVKTDPLADVVVTPIYVRIFWKAYLGGPLYSLWETLRDYGRLVENGMEPPSINLIADTMGQGNRYTLLGRAASGNRPEQIGLVHQLQLHGLCRVETEGTGRLTRYRFSVIENLPLLDAEQVEQLSGRKQFEHAWFLARYGL